MGVIERDSYKMTRWLSKLRLEQQEKTKFASRDYSVHQLRDAIVRKLVCRAELSMTESSESNLVESAEEEMKRGKILLI